MSVQRGLDAVHKLISCTLYLPLANTLYDTLKGGK